MVLVLCALTLMAADNRIPQVLQPIRTVATMLVYPLLVSVDFPQRIYKHASGFVSNQVVLAQDNRVLNQQVQLYAAQQQDMESLRRENERLRGLLNGVSHDNYNFTMAETVEAANDRIRGLVIINKGTRDGVHEGQVVLAGSHIYGQVTSVTPFSATVMQLVDRGHSIPVRNQRTGERGLANGQGRGMPLEIKNLTASTQVQDGDIYVSSGLGGLFPPDFPVARVTLPAGETRDGENIASVKAFPLVNYDAVREVLLVWDKNPANAAGKEETTNGKPTNSTPVVAGGASDVAPKVTPKSSVTSVNAKMLGKPAVSEKPEPSTEGKTANAH